MLGLIKALLSIADGLTRFARDRQLIEAGEARAALEGANYALDAINRARTARAAVSHDAGSVRDDPRNRD
tara:strand:- start:937 stop:1146 length:210 start_codon:yes stop_codon:yes gene_type:complete